LTASARAINAAVWTWNGGWCKLLGRDERHARIVARVPCIGLSRAPAVTRALGAGEVLLALAILSGHGPRRLALAQTALLLAMNLGALRWAPDELADARRTLLLNGLLLSAAWAAALKGGDR
jgi:hypothetical protein